MKKSATYRGIEDSENYECKKGKHDKYECVAKLEPIPDDDLILMYDKEANKFSCASLNDVLYALWEEKHGETPLNPMTGEAYDAEFLERMRERYGHALKDKNFTKRVIKFTATEGQLLFGEDSDTSDIPKISKTPDIPHKKEKAKDTSDKKSSAVDRIDSIKKVAAQQKLKKGERLLIIFRPSYVNPSVFEKVLSKLPEKIKWVVIESDEDAPSDLQKALGYAKQPLYLLYASVKAQPKIVYLQAIEGKNTYAKALEKLTL